MDPIIDAQEFLKLSSFINYQLSGSPINWRAILALMTRKQRPDVELLLEALSYLGVAYGQKRRKLGPLMTLHPLRVASLLSIADDNPGTLDILTAIFHDLREDINETDYDARDWRSLAKSYSTILKSTGSSTEWLLEERIHYLTRDKGLTYRQYLDRLIERASTTPELILIKLIDRLDNTSDLRLDIIDEAEKTESYKVFFEVLFTNSYRGLSFANPHQISSKINGAMRLYQLYKNMVFLALIRTKRLKLSEISNNFFRSLALASSNEAQNIVLHLFAYHLIDIDEQRELLLDILARVRRERTFQLAVDEADLVKRLILDRFDPAESAELDKRLSGLYEDKRLMCETALMFLIVFSDFINDPDFSVREI